MTSWMLALAMSFGIDEDPVQGLFLGCLIMHKLTNVIHKATQCPHCFHVVVVEDEVARIPIFWS